MIYISIIIFILLTLCYCTYSMVSSICFKRKHNIKPIMTSVQIIGHIVVYMGGIINIGICVWALFNN
jgi:hypothetical protein